jgi:glycosyltransferase involved in cell wall biosynthesis
MSNLPKNDPKSPLGEANWLLRHGDILKSIEAYDKLTRDNAVTRVVKSAAQINIQIAENRLRRSSFYPRGQRLIVYSCNFGEYESIKEPKYIDESVEYILFTDNRQLTSESWKIKYIDTRGLDARRASRLPKILAHRYLPDHDISVYIDSSLELCVSDVRLMVAQCLADEDIALYRHYKRDCVYDEIEFVLNSKDRRLIDGEKVQGTLDKYRAISYPRKHGLFENALIVRRNKLAIQQLNELWWREFESGAERDQFTFMYALHQVKIRPRAIKRGRQFRDNPFVRFYRHQYRVSPSPGSSEELSSLPVYVFIAYAPAHYKANLGRTYNDYMSLISDDAFAIFLDHDAMFCDEDWVERVKRVFWNNSDRNILLTGMTNRIGKAYQRIGLLEDDHSFENSALLTKAIRIDSDEVVHDVTQMTSISGVVLALSKKTWRASKFADGFLKVDNKQHLSIRNIGGRVLMAPGLYTYHFYRADGDLSHARRLENAKIDMNLQRPGIKIKNFVFSPTQGLDIDHYMQLVGEGEWAAFIANGALHCDKHWYLRLCNLIETETGSRIIGFGSQMTTPNAPSVDDVRVHRRFAAACIERDSPPEPVCPSAVGPQHFAGFLISKSLYEQLSNYRGGKLSQLVDAVRERKCDLVRLDSVYIYAPLPERLLAGNVPETKASPYAAREYRNADPKKLAEYRAALKARRRVAILTLGFWPNQAGMEMMIHSLALELTRSGDQVTLFTPTPDVEFEEIPHTYLLRRYKNENHLLNIFRAEHVSMPFDVLLVQGAYKAATLARKLVAPWDIPIVLRTHGEDIQIDPETNYGYRLHPEKGPVIEENIRSVEHNVVIGSHIVKDVRRIDPHAAISVIHNGVDTDRFGGASSRLLHERLGLSLDTKIIITVGRNVKKKSFHYAVDAFAVIAACRTDVVLVHAGKPGNGKDLQERAKRLGVAGRFFMLGATNYFEMPEIYRSAVLFLFPSKTETFGNVTIEAMAAGLPCVEFDYVANREKINHGVNGYIVPYGDVEQLAERALELLCDDRRRLEFGRAARRAAGERFSWASVAAKYRVAFEAARQHRENCSSNLAESNVMRASISRKDGLRVSEADG